MSQSPCYLHQPALINALGDTCEAIASTLLASISPLSPCDDLLSGRTTYVGQIARVLSPLPEDFRMLDCANHRLLAACYEQIRAQVDNLKNRYGRGRIGVVLGTSTSGVAAGEAAYQYRKDYGKFPERFAYCQQEIGIASEFLAKYADVSGLHYTLSTACSSSAKAFITAARLLRSDLCDAVIVGGSDTLCELTLNGFDCLDLLAPDLCRPFSHDRKGLNIGEAAALFVMSREPSDICLQGSGESSDGYHITAPHPRGKGALSAMQSALQSAGLTPEQIGYINCHGTGTLHNDQAESHAIHDLVRDNCPCSSTKPLTGHTLGAAGATELALCYLLLSDRYNPDRRLPAQVGSYQSDDSLSPMHLLRSETHWEQPYFLSNSFAFGGNNVSLLLGKNA